MRRETIFAITTGVPGFSELGAANPEKGGDAPHHNARYRLDERWLAWVYSRSVSGVLFGALNFRKMVRSKRETHSYEGNARQIFALAEWLGRSFVPAHSGRGCLLFRMRLRISRAFARQLAKLAIEAGRDI
ncbi:MAG: hypothetical protein ACLRRT_08705 [Ruthenibacterium lactatiformans]